MAGPLDGLVVLDIATVMPASIAGMLLADHGAEVIKVEPPGGAFYAGDLTRKSWDRGKLSVTLDLRDEGDCRKARALAARADILIHSLSREDARARGFDRDALKADNPGLIVCALSAYGFDTPLSDRPYGESLAAARLGLMNTLSSPRRVGPVYPGHPALHYGHAFVIAIGALAALRARRINGQGQTVDASMLDGAAALSVMHWWQEGGQSFMAGGDRSSPLRFGRTRIISAMLQGSDGEYFYLNTTGGSGFKRVMDMFGFGDRVKAVAGPEFAVPLDDDEYQAARFEINDAALTRTRDEWVRMLHAADVAALPVLAPAKVLRDEQIAATGHAIALSDPDYGTITQGAPAFRFRDNAAPVPKPAPGIGAHNSALAGLLARAPRPPSLPREPITAPLQGVKIIDVGVFFACSFAARLLSDLGADVIKVEALEGDQMRPLADLYDGAQRGKRNIALNLKTAEGQEVLRKLIGDADIVLHNLRPGNAEKLGFGATEMMAANPRLIYAYMPGYGATGPKAMLKSFAPLLSCWTGVMHEGAGAGNPPMTAALGNEDVYNGLLGAVGLLTALEARERTGKGDYFECPQLHSSVFTAAAHFLDARGESVYGLRLDAEQCGFSALDRIYQTKDGWICIACREEVAFRALADAIGAPHLKVDTRFADGAARTRHDEALISLLKPIFAGLSNAEAQAALDAAGAPAEIVREQNGMSALLHEAWAQESDRVFEDRESIKGHIKVIGLVTRLDGTPGVRKGPAARLGEHTEQILAELGYGADGIARLTALRAVGVAS
ncbi:CAIB/BAIF family protein [alpha proteobacterium U9-1i]|nr:CAIB/BAIF family protein [alpha proteobacterium U9-1i]